MFTLNPRDQHAIDTWDSLPDEKVVSLRVVGFMIDRDPRTVQNDISRKRFPIPYMHRDGFVVGCRKSDVTAYIAQFTCSRESA